MLTKADGLGFGFSDVHFDAGAEAVLWYKHHWEANHIISGTGEVTDLTTGQTWKLEPSMAYSVGPEDRHRMRATTDIHLLSVFCPPLVGNEQHDKDGALPERTRPAGPARAVSRAAATGIPGRWCDRKRRRRREFETTNTLEPAIATPARSGLSRPVAARGSAATL